MAMKPLDIEAELVEGHLAPSALPPRATEHRAAADRLWSRTQTVHLLLELKADGARTYGEKTNRGLFRYIVSTARDTKPLAGRIPNSSPLPLAREGSEKKPLQSRDLRGLDLPFSASNQPSIMIRHECILLNFDPLRAIVLGDRLLVLVPNGADAILTVLQDRLYSEATEAQDPDTQGEAQSVPLRTSFCLRAIDAVIVTVVENLERELQQLVKDVSDAMGSLTRGRGFTVKMLEKIRNLKNSLRLQELRAQRTRDAIEEFLDDEEDLEMMALAVQSSATPLPVADTPSSPGAIMDQDSDVAELLFESFLQSVSTVQAKLEVVRGNVTNGEEYHRARLDTVRNSILNAEILFSLVSMCASLANLVVGMFGMNLRNGHEGSTRAFTTVASVATGIVILLSVTLGARYRQIGVISAFPGDG